MPGMLPLQAEQHLQMAQKHVCVCVPAPPDNAKVSELI